MKNRFVGKSTVVFCLVSVLVLAPVGAKASVQDIVSLFTKITGTLQKDIGLALADIQAVNTNISNFERQVVWPIALISQSRTEVSQVRTQLSSVANQIQSLPMHSATLANPSHLEQLLRNQQASSFGQMSMSYTQVYQSLPQPNQATDAQRNLVDADDALALGDLKTATISDQASQQMLTVADGIELQAAVSAPGSAPILTAQAQAANLQNQAMLQKLLAAELRQEAARLAHTNALRKQSADANKALRNNMLRILTR